MPLPSRTATMAHLRRTASSGLVALALLLAACQPEPEPAPSPLQRACSFPAFFRPEPGQAPVRMAVIGAFNGWSTETHPMADPDGDGIYQALVPSTPGRHTYMIYVDGQAVLDPYNPLTLYADGREQSLADLSHCDAPALEVKAVETRPDGEASVEVRFLRSALGSPLDTKAVEVHIDAPDTAKNRANLGISPGTETISVALTGLDPGKYQISVRAADTDGSQTEPITLPLWIEPGHFEWKDAVIYQVMVDRFRRGGGELSEAAGISAYHGGDLHGVIEAIEEGYFDELGVNALWVSPLYDNPDGEYVGRDGQPSEAYHGYWARSARSVEERFGGEEALDALMEAAHRRGIRVIMDAVLNHVHIEHPYFVERRDEDWFNHVDGDCICGFTCSWGRYMESCWFDPFLADLRWESEAVVETMTEDALWWLERFRLDGLRLDAVPMMPRLAMRHLRHKVSERLEQGGDHIYLLGETYTSRGGQGQISYYLGEHALSGQFDFPVMWALRSALAERVPMTDLDAEVAKSEAAWQGAGAVMAPFLGNHDVPRFISDINGDVTWEPRTNPPLTPGDDLAWGRLKMGWTFVLTQPGAPVIYYGDEIGMPGGNDPDNRRNMRFGDEVSERGQQLRDHVVALGRARRCSTALRRGDRQTLMVDSELYIYGRDAGDGHPAIVALNGSNRPRTVELDVPEAWSLAQDATFQDLFDQPVTSAGRKVLMTVPPRTSMVLLTECR